MALKLFGGGKGGHPLADDKEAKKIFAELPSEPAKALEEIRDWIESVGAADDMKAEKRAELVRLLDDTAQPHLRKLSRDYLANPRLPRVQESRQWDVLYKYWKVASDGYSGCLDLAAADKGAAGRMKAILPLIGVRAIRAAATEMKWNYFHYAHAETEVWQKLAKAYLFFEERKLAKENVAAYPPATTSAEREFMKVLMLAASSPDSLTPLEIELAEQVIAHFGASSSFLIAPTHQPQVTYYWVDLAAGAPPRRVAQAPQASAGLRFFAAGDAAGKLDELIRKVEKGAVPSDVNLGGTYELPQVLAVLRHLQTYWAATPPVRKHDRYAVKHKLNVVNGFTGLLAKLNGTGAAPAEVPDGVAAAVARAAGVQAAAAAGGDAWESENIGAGGIGALASATLNEWLRVGALVGLQVEGGSKSLAVGMVRRCSRRSRVQLGIGVRTFARDCFAVRLADLDALLLNDSSTLGQEVLVCLRGGTFDARASLTLSFEGANVLLMPVEMVYAGDDYDVARFKVMNQG